MHCASSEITSASSSDPNRRIEIPPIDNRATDETYRLFDRSKRARDDTRASKCRVWRVLTPSREGPGGSSATFVSNYAPFLIESRVLARPGPGRKNIGLQLTAADRVCGAFSDDKY